MGINHQFLIKAWFSINGIITLFPPFYLVLDERIRIGGLPLTLIYFLFVSASCGLSVIYAHHAEG